MDGAEIAFGLALGCLNPNQPAFDLSRALKPKATIREIFPWGELALQVALLICLGLVACRPELGAGQYLSGGAGGKGPPCRAWLRRRQRSWKRRETNCGKRLTPCGVFSPRRILWSAYTHDLPARLPDNAQFVSLEGFCELENFGKKGAAIKPKKSFNLHVTAPIGSKDSMPHEIDNFVNALRNHPLLKNDFPEVLLADIKRFQAFTGRSPWPTSR